MEEIIGYKGFNKDLKCNNGFQYEIGKSYEMYDKPKICKIGYHFCNELRDIFVYNVSNCRICKIRAYGDIDSNGTDKSCTNKIEILEEIYVSPEDRIRYVYANLYNLSDKKLDKLLSKEFILDKYINDKNWHVKLAVAYQGYGLDKLINDKDWHVRLAVAKQGYGLDKLINDEDWRVRLAVAKQGYGLNILIYDPSLYVNEAAERQLELLNKNKE